MGPAPRWRRGWDDLLPLGVLATPLLLAALLAGARVIGLLVLAIAALAVGLLLKHLLPDTLQDVAVVPPVIALLGELSVVPLSEGTLFLAGTAGVGLLLWTGTGPVSGVPWVHRLEPVVVPALAVGLALAVMLFLPIGSGGQVGLAALVLVVVLGWAAWLYLRSGAEAAVPSPTS